MAARQEVTLVIRARDRTRAVFRRINRSFARLAAVATGIGAGLLAGTGAFLRRATQAAQDIDNAAATLGASAEEIQALEIWARGRGADLRDLQDAILQLQGNAADAATSNGILLDTFQRLGVQAPLPESGVELFFRLAEGVRLSQRSLQQLTGDLDSLLGEEATRQFLGAFREGGNLRAEILQRAASDDVRREEEIKRSAEFNRKSQEELTAAMNRLTNVMLDNLPDLLNTLNALLTTIEQRNTAEGITPGGLEEPGSQLFFQKGEQGAPGAVHEEVTTREHPQLELGAAP